MVNTPRHSAVSGCLLACALSALPAQADTALPQPVASEPEQVASTPHIYLLYPQAHRVSLANTPAFLGHLLMRHRIDVNTEGNNQNLSLTEIAGADRYSIFLDDNPNEWHWRQEEWAQQGYRVVQLTESDLHETPLQLSLELRADNRPLGRVAPQTIHAQISSLERLKDLGQALSALRAFEQRAHQETAPPSAPALTRTKLLAILDRDNALEEKLKMFGPEEPLVVNVQCPRGHLARYRPKVNAYTGGRASLLTRLGTAFEHLQSGSRRLAQRAWHPLMRKVWNPTKAAIATGLQYANRAAQAGGQRATKALLRAADRCCAPPLADPMQPDFAAVPTRAGGTRRSYGAANEPTQMPGQLGQHRMPPWSRRDPRRKIAFDPHRKAALGKAS